MCSLPFNENPADKWFFFTVRTPGGKLYPLKCRTAQERNSWKDAITKAIKRSKITSETSFESAFKCPIPTAIRGASYTVGGVPTGAAAGARTTSYEGQMSNGFTQENKGAVGIPEDDGPLEPKNSIEVLVPQKILAAHDNGRSDDSDNPRRLKPKNPKAWGLDEITMAPSASFMDASSKAKVNVMLAAEAGDPVLPRVLEERAERPQKNTRQNRPRVGTDVWGDDVFKVRTFATLTYRNEDNIFG
jgi:hypothetical protein